MRQTHSIAGREKTVVKYGLLPEYASPVFGARQTRVRSASDWPGVQPKAK